MHAIYFRWKVVAGREPDFEQTWRELTELIRDERGGLGSRLHRCADGHYFGSSRFAGERILDFQEEVGCVPKSVGHALDDFDAIVDAFED